MNKLQNKRKPKAARKAAGTSKEPGDEKPDVICISRQLNITKQAKVKMRSTPLKRRVKTHTLPKPSVPRRPMPTFSDLEKMFDDSEIGGVPNPESGTSNTYTNPLLLSNNILYEEIISNANTNHPNQNTICTNIQLIADNTDETAANYPIKCENSKEIVDLACTRPNYSCNEIIIIDDDESDVKLVQGTKRKRNLSEIGDVILKIDMLDEEQPHKIRKLSNDESNLTKCDNEGFDSDVTVIYDIEAPLKKLPAGCSSPPKRFSPLPSTSTDNAIIHKNDKIFMQSLSETIPSSTKGTHISQASEITVIDDDESNQSSKAINRTDVDSKFQSDSENIEDLTITEPTSNDIDIDALIAENETILTKYKTVENLPAVINVTPTKNINQTVNADIVSQNLSTTRDMNQSNPVVPQRRVSPQLNASMAHIARPSHNIRTQLVYTPPWDSNLTQTMLIYNPQSLSHISSGLNCPICLENVRSVESASTTCGHIFCLNCIKRALKTAKRCPTCRKSLRGIGYHRLFL